MFQKHNHRVWKNKDQNGFTLIEVMIAMAVFAIGILAIFSMQVTATNGNALARQKTENYTCATDKAEELLALDYNHADLDPDLNPHTAAKDSDGIDNDGDGLIDADDVDGEDDGYVSLRWEVFENADRTLKSIQVTVEPTFNPDNRTRVNIDVQKGNM